MGAHVSNYPYVDFPRIGRSTLPEGVHRPLLPLRVVQHILDTPPRAARPTERYEAP